MGNHIARPIGFSFLIIFVCIGATNAQHGLSPELAAGIVISTKSACDRGIPGYKEKTDTAYARWKLQNTETISRAAKAKWDGLTFDNFIQRTAARTLSLPKNDLQKACDGIIEQLELPLR